MNKLTVTVTRQSKPEAKCIAALPPLLQQKMRHVCSKAICLFVCAMYARRRVLERPEAAGANGPLEVKAEMPAPFSQRRSLAESLGRELSKPSSFHRSGVGDCVPRPIQSDNTNLFMYFRGSCHYSTTTPCTIHVLGKLAAAGIKDESCRKRRWWTCVPCETCGADPKGPELAKNNDDPKLYTSIFNLDLYLYIYIFILSSGCLCSIWVTSYCLLLTFSLAGAWSVRSQCWNWLGVEHWPVQTSLLI